MLALSEKGEETFKELVLLYQEKQKFNPADLRKIKGIAFWDENGKIEMTARKGIYKKLGRDSSFRL